MLSPDQLSLAVKTRSSSTAKALRLRLPLSLHPPPSFAMVGVLRNYLIDPATSAVFYPEKDLYLVKRVKDPSDRIALDALRFASYLIKELKVILP